MYFCIYSLVENFIKDRDINKLKKEFAILDEAYGNYGYIKGLLQSCIADAYLLIGDYDSYWTIESQRGGFEDVLNIKRKCTNTSISAEESIIMVGATSLTSLGKENHKEIKQLVGIFLNDFEVQNGANLIENFVNHFDYWNLTEKDFDELKYYITYEDNKLPSSRIYKNKEEWFYKLKMAHLLRTDNMKKGDDFFLSMDKKRTLFNFFSMPNKPEIDYKYIPQIIIEALRGKLHEILRESENTFREERDIPKICEGWAYETLLYYRIKEVFSEEKVIHHGRPTWLGRQHLDIFFPDKNIGVEYQGMQHSIPVEYFGGIESFKKRQELDARKQALCLQNKCHLIYVYPNYDFNKIKKNIEQYL